MAFESSSFLLFPFPLVYFDLFRSIGPKHPVIWLLPAEFRRNIHPRDGTRANGRGGRRHTTINTWDLHNNQRNVNLHDNQIKWKPTQQSN